MKSSSLRISDLRGQAVTAVRAARRGETVAVTARGQVVATIGPAADPMESEPPPGPVRFGTLRGKIQIADDFDAPLADFEDYR